jgi:hypothetical protein
MFMLNGLEPTINIREVFLQESLSETIKTLQLSVKKNTFKVCLRKNLILLIGLLGHQS